MSNETEKAARLSKRVVEEIEKMTQLLSQEIGLDPQWIPNEIVFQATKIVRERMYADMKSGALRLPSSEP